MGQFVDVAKGCFDGEVVAGSDSLTVAGRRIAVCQEPAPEKLPWGELGVDVVFECTGLFRTAETAGKHIAGGAKKVVISAPGGADIDGTFVYGVNDGDITADSLDQKIYQTVKAQAATKGLEYKNDSAKYW